MVIRKWPEPKNVKELQQFIGLANYYRKFVCNFSKIAYPLYKLLKNNIKWIWNNKYKNSFEKIKNAIIEPVMLWRPDWNKTFILDTDASNYSIGGILSQYIN